MENEILSPQTEYKYAPLQELHSVRLLKLHLEGSYEAPIRISLREVSLESCPIRSPVLHMDNRRWGLLIV